MVVIGLYFREVLAGFQSIYVRVSHYFLYFDALIELDGQTKILSYYQLDKQNGALLSSRIIEKSPVTVNQLFELDFGDVSPLLNHQFLAVGWSGEYVIFRYRPPAFVPLEFWQIVHCRAGKEERNCIAGRFGPHFDALGGLASEMCLQKTAFSIDKLVDG